MSSLASPSQRKDLSLLGLSTDRFGNLPEQEAIRRAYRSRALEVHPDKNPTRDNTEFLLVQGAYENLTSPVKLKEEKLKQQHQAAAAAARPKSPGVSSPSSTSRTRGTYFTQNYQQQQTTSTAVPRSRTPTMSNATRPPFSTKPVPKYSHPSASSPKTPLQSSSSCSPGVGLNRRTNSFTSSSTTSSSSTPNTRGGTTMSSSLSGTTSTTTVNPKSVSFPPGSHVIPPPFASSSSQNFLKAPFPAFLPDGQTYLFETDPSAFGIYSRHLRHGDSAKISCGVNPRTGEEIFVSGIVIGVAADGNLYWWKLSSSSSSPAEVSSQQQTSSSSFPMMNNGFGSSFSSSSFAQLDSFATFLAPRIPSNAEQQANRIMVSKQGPPIVQTMDPLNFSPQNQQQQYQTNSPYHSYSPSSASAANTPSAFSQHQQQTCSGLLSEEELFEMESEKRNTIWEKYSSWLGEAIWCFNLPVYSNADAVRFSRVL